MMVQTQNSIIFMIPLNERRKIQLNETEIEINKFFLKSVSFS